MVSWPLMIVATAPSAFANNISVILLFRFFTGCCAGCAINNGAGMIPDIYHNDRVAQAKSASFRSVMDTNIMTSHARLAVAY